MSSLYQPLFPDAFLAARWSVEYESFRYSHIEAELIQRLSDWAEKKQQKETAAENAFVGLFFKQTWGYRAAGEASKADGFTCESHYAIKRAGQMGGTGAADLALGHFERIGVSSTPQVLCEFKDVRSGLDKPQNRKGNDRSPVKQCADYLKEAANELYGTESIQPSWGIVSDMNEFRLYWRKKMPSQYQRFVVKSAFSDDVALLGKDNAAAFARFTFWRMFQHDMLLTTGGPSPLEKLLTEQWVQERVIESDFYKEYQAYRQSVFQTLVDANPGFKGTRSRLVRLTQRFLDRCIFILFCEDMGPALKFPPHILRDVLIGVSSDPDYDPGDDAAWQRVKKLFVSMRDGSPFRDNQINRFNGGLFAVEPELETLHIPSYLFCARGQGVDAQQLMHHKMTLLFFSANYNFGLSGATFERSVGLTTLGRIFEQSITELEFMEAKADGRVSISELSKRKRDGVYYTPEWVTSYIVEETVGALLADLRRRFSLDPLPTLLPDELAHFQNSRAGGKTDRRFNTERAEQYLMNLDRYAIELDDIKIVDPACGSGAFLIQALDRLVTERRWLAVERERVIGSVTLFDSDAVMKATLSNNIYGVDINQESIEITRLALWLHTALPDRPLTSLDDNIRCGNSLIDSEFFRFKQESLFSEEERERINVFDWEAAFPKVFARSNGKSGFDCVVGNPPYVKLQHFRQVLPDVAQYLHEAREPSGSGPLYSSTQSRSFDMYLPFIERGIALLNHEGRMGYIAPNVWLINEYGEGLRAKLLKSRRLERWVDFKDYPVFDEAMTYTALQFYRGRPSDGVACFFSPDGDVGGIEWSRPDALIKYTELPGGDAWVFLSDNEGKFLKRLRSTCTRLDEIATAIFVGIQTSADEIYHLERSGQDRYLTFQSDKFGVEVEIEDALMRPLVSGEEAKRYQVPATDTYLLFPYDDTEQLPRLYTVTEMAVKFPRGWQYLLSAERKLRQRERGAFDDDSWFRFGRNQNIERQKRPKLGVAQTAPEIRVFCDENGAYCLNNVRVNGIQFPDVNTGYFLQGVLNSRVIDFVFRRISKPKEPRPSGAYFEANKQYIAPLPIPAVGENDKLRVANMARALQRLHTARRDVIRELDRRLQSDQLVSAPRPASWFWAEIGDQSFWQRKNSDGLTGRALATWAKRMSAEKFEVHLAEIQQVLSFGATMCAAEKNGELTFFVDDRLIVSGVYVSEREAPLILAQWRQKARNTFVSDTVDARTIVSRLLDLKSTDNRALVDQLRILSAGLDAHEHDILKAEREIEEFLYELYGLSDEERGLVEADTRSRWNARIPVPPAR